MSPAVNLRSLQVLNDLRAALVRYSHDALQSLADAAMEIQRTLAWLAERVAWWQAEVRRLQEVVRRARGVATVPFEQFEGQVREIAPAGLRPV